jgi:hypothetical protein
VEKIIEIMKDTHERCQMQPEIVYVEGPRETKTVRGDREVRNMVGDVMTPRPTSITHEWDERMRRRANDQGADLPPLPRNQTINQGATTLSGTTNYNTLADMSMNNARPGATITQLQTQMPRTVPTMTAGMSPQSRFNVPQFAPMQLGGALSMK